jgi:hypothetical protein
VKVVATPRRRQSLTSRSNHRGPPLAQRESCGGITDLIKRTRRQKPDEARLNKQRVLDNAALNARIVRA